MKKPSRKIVEQVELPEYGISVHIYEENGSYYFDEEGDHYNESWIKNPLEECIKDARKNAEWIHSGQRAQDMIADKAYARQEQIASGNW